MRTAIKVFLTFVVIFLGTPLFALVQQTPLLKLLLVAALAGGIYGIWKYNPDSSVDSNAIMGIEKAESEKLDKSQH